MSKYKSRNGTPEVHSARSKLEGVLQTLVTKTGDSPPERTVESDEGEDLTLTPTKRANIRANRKRKRGKDEVITGTDIAQYHHTYVMKLFDRSVDLAQFDEDSPLYPICRAWMRNQPHNRNLGPREHSPEPEPDPTTMFEEDDDVYILPDPLPIKQEGDARIPEPEPQPDEHLDIHADPDSAPAPEQILLNHMVRWKNIRQRWKEAGFRNESRYACSMEILKNMYDKQCTKDN